MDTDIPYRLAGLAFALIQLISIIILMSQVAWQVFILFIIILALSVWCQVIVIDLLMPILVFSFLHAFQFLIDRQFVASRK